MRSGQESSVTIGFNDNDPTGDGIIAGSGHGYGSTRAGFHQGSFAYVQDNTQADAPYFFQGRAEFLDAPGEWSYDSTTHILQYVTGSDTAPAPGQVVIPQLQTLLSVTDASDVSLEGLSFRYSNWSAPANSGYASSQTAISDWIRLGGPIPGAVRLTNTERLSFVGNSIRATAATGVEVDGVTRDIRIADNDLQRIGGSGVMLYAGMSVRVGNSEDPADYPDRIVGASVTDNVIRDVGVHYADAGAIVGTLVCSTRVEHNDLSGSGQSGIALGGFTFYAADPKKPGSENEVFDRCERVEHVSEPNAVVANRIGASMQQLSDGGGIYVLGSMPGMRIADNLISGIGRSPWAGMNPVTGIYLDAHSQHMTIEHNVLDIPEQTHAFFAGNGANRDNIFRDNHHNEPSQV